MRQFSWSKNRITDFVIAVSKGASKHNIATYAASTSFFFFLSMFPMIILFCALIPYTPLELDYIVAAVNNLAPEVLRPLLISMITGIYLRSAGTLTVSAVVTLWTAGRGMMELVKAIDTAYDYAEERGYIRLRVHSSAYTLIMLLMVGLSLIILVFGRRILSILLKKPGIEHIYEFIESILKLQYIFAFVVILIMVWVLFSKFTAVRTGFRKNLLGALFSTVLWLTSTYLFSVFLGIYNPFSVYGTLATTIILMIWLYVCMYCLILGAEINRIYQKKNAGDGGA